MIMQLTKIDKECNKDKMKDKMKLYEEWHGKTDNEKWLDTAKIMNLIILYHIVAPKKNKEDNSKKKKIEEDCKLCRNSRQQE